MPKLDRDRIVLESRKAQHVKIALEEDVNIHGTSNGFEHFEIVPRSIPDVNYHEISLDTTFLGKVFSAPILVAGMTGGYPEAEKINISLARICSKLNIPLGVGSQRAMIVNPEMTPTFNVKHTVPDVFLIGNLGLVQFCMDFGTKEFDQALDWTSKVLRIQGKKIRDDIIQMTMLLNLLIHYELGNQLLLEHLVRTTYRYFSKNKEFERAAMIRDRLKSLEHLGVSLSLDGRIRKEKFKDLDRAIKKINQDLKYGLKYRENFRIDRKSTRLNSSHTDISRMPSSA